MSKLVNSRDHPNICARATSQRALYVHSCCFLIQPRWVLTDPGAMAALDTHFLPEFALLNLVKSTADL